MKNINVFITGCLLVVTFLVVGCGPSSVIINPDYNSPIFKKKNLRDKTKITKVIDKRVSVQNNNVGIVQVGLFNNRVPYDLAEPVNDFVKKALNNIFNSSSKDTLIVPIMVTIDTFKVYELTTAFSEKGCFDCYLSFLYPFAKDSIKVIKTKSSKSSSGLDVTNSLESLIYEGLADCSNQFEQTYNSDNNRYFVHSDKVNELKIDSSYSNAKLVKNDTIPVIKRDFVSNIGLAYVAGNKITNGFQLSYQMYDLMKATRKLQGGFGYSFSFYNIENRSSFLKGNFISFNYRYSLRYSLDDSHRGFYFGGSLRLSFGSENIKYYNETKTNYFIGPTIEETIGYSIAEKVFLEAGLFQIKHFGSDLLPDDIGFSLGINFKL